ncbi:MAG: hypothetical protein ABIB47_00260 [Candidatus Woesearchaeota archaeon]
MEEKQTQYFAYFDGCKEMENMPPVQIGEADSKEREAYFQENRFVQITDESFKHYKDLGKSLLV